MCVIYGYWVFALYEGMCVILGFLCYLGFFELNGYICVILGMCALLTHISPYNSHTPI